MFAYGVPFTTSWVGGVPDLVIWRSVMPTTHTYALESSDPAFDVDTWPVLLTLPVPSPHEATPVSFVVGEMMWTVKVLLACVVPADTVTGPQSSTGVAPPVIAHWDAPLPQPEPWLSI